MAYSASVTTSVSLETTAATTSSLNNLLFVTTNAYSFNRLTSFSSWSDVKSDTTIPSTSNAYTALKQCFNSTGGTAVPVYLGRRLADDVTLTADLDDSTEYSFDLQVRDSDLNTETYEISFTSDSDATLAEISAGLDAAFTTAAVVGATCTDNTDGSITLEASTDYEIVIDDITELEDSYTTSETAAELLEAIQIENNEDWYFMACEDHTETFVLAMASEIEATGSDDYPKTYVVGNQETSCLSALASVAVNIPAQLEALGYLRTFPYWHHECDTNFSEVAIPCVVGRYTAGTTTWQFVDKPSGITVAYNPSTEKSISTAQAGYLEDHKCSYFFTERGLEFSRGATSSSGEWCDIVQAADWIVSEAESRLLTFLTTQTGSKVSFTKKDKARVAAVIDGVLDDGVDNGILAGYVPTSVPDSVSFADQAARILQDVSFTGYLAGAIHTAVIDGILTYSEEDL